MNYQLGPWDFTPTRCLLSSNNLERELDPLTFKLLSHFIDNPNRIITRQELIENVWQQNFVDDNAINRAISELRKQLNHPEHKAPLIKTHYRKGYGLTVDVVPVEHDATPTRQEHIDSQHEDKNEILPHKPTTAETEAIKTGSHNFRWLLITAIVLLIINIAINLYEKISSKSEQQATAIQPLKKAEERKDIKDNSQTSTEINDVKISAVTWKTGIEFRPLVSPDKRIFAYTNRQGSNVKSYVKQLNGTQEVALSFNDLNITVMSWQPQANILLTEATNYKDTCYYAAFDLSS
ncbi:MAG: winged helix family transcriptional regulator, partial [Colwellia sp.]|nr:winged helix family transcriptional regulator [Colwellia sp.]